jgi:hypothetical protein
VVIEPDSTAELRVLFEGKPPIVRHYKASDRPRMARDAIKLGQGAKGTYFLLNPLPPGWSGGTAKDGDIIRRRWLLVDCDPKRAGTVSSTDAEKELAHEKAFEVATYLEGQGWPNPIICDSGNGWHLLYRIDLPADDGGLVASVLKALAARFSDDAVDIDTKVGNASRICKLYGSLAAKGGNTSERPHRVSKVDSIPDPLAVVPTELLQKLASEGETPPEPVRRPPSPPDAGARVSRPQAIEQARNYLLTMDPSISGEHGHDKLLKAASILVNDFGLTDGEALDLLVTDFNPRCVPPWEVADITRKISEAKKNPPSRTPKGEHRLTEEDETTVIVEEPWPAALGPDAFHGIAGEIIRKIEPHTESDQAALLIQFLVATGNLVGRHRYVQVEATRHYANLFAVLVGSSSIGRKGTAGDQINRLMTLVDKYWSSERKVSGLVSGEGLVWNVRDPSYKPDGTAQDEGVADKRLMVYESEFSSVLKAKSRDSNTLGEALRQSWDCGHLRTAAKNCPAKATDAHVSLTGHITADELREVTREVDKVNGLANRFLWCCVRRSKLLPDGGKVHRENFDHEIAQLKRAVEFASHNLEIERSEEAANEWRRIYPELTRERVGTLGAICNRAAPQVIRLSLVYAILDCSDFIQIEHLRAAIEIWRYCEESVRFVFGNELSNRTANTILKSLRCSLTDGLSRTAISKLFNGNKSKAEIDSALQILHSARLARRSTIPTDGRSAEVWFALE